MSQRRDHPIARAAMWVYYQGAGLRGFQAQPEGDTVQQHLERGFRQLGLGGRPAPAGRTDRGVHARMQVISIKGVRSRLEGLGDNLRALLPKEIGLCLTRFPKPEFHAQWSSCGKEYRYRFALGQLPDAWKRCAWNLLDDDRLPGPPDPSRVAALLAMAKGTRDFSAFHENSSKRTPRTLSDASLQEIAPGIFEARLVGDRFARYQVRYLVGSAVAAASGQLPEELFIAALTDAQSMAGTKAPGEGLTLWEVHYPPTVDPFTEEERQAPPHLPNEPPFYSVS